MKKMSPSMVGVGSLAVCFLLALFPSRFLTALSRLGEDVLIRSAARSAPSDEVVIVDIDEESLQAYGQWPWPRRILAQLTRRLADYGAAVVAFDVVFPETDRMSPDSVLASWQRDYGKDVRISGLPGDRLDDDRAFADSLGCVPCILGCSMEMGRAEKLPAPDLLPPYRGRFVELGEPRRAALPQASGMIASLSVLKEAAASTAFFNTTVDEDNVVRRTPLLFALGPDRIYPSLSLEALRLKLGVENIRIVYEPGGRLGIRDIRLLEQVIPTDAHGRLALNFRNTPFPRFSAAAVLGGRAAPVWFQNRIILIGTSAAGMRDLAATPLQPETPGVDIHATALDNMLAGDMLRTPCWGVAAQMTALLLLNGCLIPLFKRVRAWVGLLLVSVAVALVLAVAVILLHRYGLLFSPVDVVLTALVIYTLMTVVKYWDEEIDRRRMRLMFGTMVSREVLGYLDAHPDSFALAGRKAEATVLFSDIHNFSAMAESMEPDILSQLLNRYLTPMADLVMTRGGYVDKFNGDAMMAVWGAPYPVPDHATQACWSALEQLSRLSELRAELAARFGQDIRIRIGINTGVVTAGNMGSERRFQYTVLGDPVNQAFRYEAVAKYFGVWTVIGEETWRQAQANVEARCLDVVTIKGKTRPVAVYELLSRKGELEAGRKALMAMYEEALDDYRHRDFKRAVVRLEKVTRDLPDDRPALLLLERARRFLREAPASDWPAILRLDFLGDPAGR